MIKWANILSNTTSKSIANFNKAYKKKKVKDRRYEFKKALDTGKTSKNSRDLSTLLCRGDHRLYKLCSAMMQLDRFLYPLESYQRNLLNLYINTVLPQLYGKDWEEREELVKDLLGITCPIKQSCIGILPRRYGKTELTARFGAAFMGCDTVTNVRYYSQGARQSLSAMESIKKMTQILMPDGFIIVQNQEKLQIRLTNDKGRVCKFSSFPASINGQRGSGASGSETLDLAIADEFMFWKNGVYHRAFVPTNVRAGTSVLMISTYNMDDRRFEGLLDPLINGEVSSIESFRLQGACGSCIAAGKYASCRHVERPSFHSDESLEMVTHLMNDPESLAVETFGIRLGGSSMSVLAKEHIEYLFKEDRKVKITDTASVKKIFCVIDPSWGGAASEYAIVSLCVVDDKTVILGADSIRNSDSMECCKMVITHLKYIATKYPCASIYTCVESNLGSEPGILYRELSKDKVLNYRIVIFSNADNRMGPLTDQNIKILSTEVLIRILRAELLRISTAFYSHTRTEKDTLALLYKQFLEYKRNIKIRQVNNIEKESISYSGKAPGVCDDLVICVSLGCYYRRFSEIKPSFNRPLCNA